MRINLSVDLTLSSTEILIKVVTILLTNAITDFKINKRSVLGHETAEIKNWIYRYDLSFSTTRQEIVDEIRELLKY